MPKAEIEEKYTNNFNQSFQKQDYEEHKEKRKAIAIPFFSLCADAINES